jgi:Asp/Glu/hydantoin racemase
MHQLEARCSGIRMLDGPFRDISDVQEEEALLVELCNLAIAEDGAEVLILAGAPLASLAGVIKDRIRVPVVDQVGAAVKQAETLVALQPRKAAAGSFRRPDPKPTIGLSPALARRIEGQDPPAT